MLFAPSYLCKKVNIFQKKHLTNSQKFAAKPLDCIYIQEVFVMKFAAKVKSTLLSTIHEMAQDPTPYVKNPGKDFSRERKLGFENSIRLMLSLSKKSTQDELLDFFEHEESTPTISALIQQRNKMNDKLFPTLLQKFNTVFQGKKLYKNHRLLACDGSDLNIFRNPDDSSTYYCNSSADKGFNEIHIDALYDLCNRTYQKINIDGRHNQDERRALINFMKEYKPDDKCIFIADRNYESYNLIAHAQTLGLDYLIRIKDINSNGILCRFHFPPDIGAFDKEISLKLVRSKHMIDKNNPEDYRLINSSSDFDFIERSSNGVFPICFRIVRFLIDNERYESIITSLDSSEFPPETIKKLYSMRWGIETSFRELKYTIGMNQLHSKKVDHIKQEIYAKIIMYNFCAIITGHVAVKKTPGKHTYQINFSRAIKECLYYFTCKSDTDPPDVEAVIKKYLLPVRPGRTNPRKVKIREKAIFLYR